MTQRLQSTGQEIHGPAEELSYERLNEIRAAGTMHSRKLEEIAGRREEQAIRQQSGAHDDAVKNFDVRYRDVTVENPALLRVVVDERQRKINEMAQRGEVVHDWNAFYTEVGEAVRKKAGLPSGEKLERDDALSEMRKSRGQKG